MITEKVDSCFDCGAGLGELHAHGCDVERCPYCGGQMISCFCDDSFPDGVPDKDRMPWDGFWPGDRECEEYGWYARVPRNGEMGGWIPCGPEEPGAQPDINRLRVEARWDRALKRWVRAEEP